MSGELQLTPLDRAAPPAEDLGPVRPARPRPDLRTWAALGWRGLRVEALEAPRAAVPVPISSRDAGLRVDAGDRVAPVSEPLVEAPVRSERLKRTWREQRWERRRRRRIGEEILGWILVPIILASLYWATKAGLAAFGTTPTALVQGIKAAFGGRGS